MAEGRAAGREEAREGAAGGVGDAVWRRWDAAEWAGLAAFLQPLLTWDPADRPSAGEALRQPWLQGACEGGGAAGGSGEQPAVRWAARR